MLRWMLGNLLVWAVLFFGVPYAGVRFVPPEAGMMFTMALWLAVYPLYIGAGEPFGRTAQMEHPVAAAGASRAVRWVVWLDFPHCAGACYLRGLLAVGYGFMGAGWA